MMTFILAFVRRRALMRHVPLAHNSDGWELWAATDKAVWPAVWNKGLSSARHLFNLVLVLKQEARKYEVFLHCYHISGD